MKSYTALRMNGGTAINAYNKGQAPGSCLATRRAAVERRYTRPSSTKINEDSSSVGIPSRAISACPYELCSEANLNLPSGSCLITNCTEPVHRLQTPSNKMILSIARQYWPVLNSTKVQA